MRSTGRLSRRTIPSPTNAHVCSHAMNEWKKMVIAQLCEVLPAALLLRLIQKASPMNGIANPALPCCLFLLLRCARLSCCLVHSIIISTAASWMPSRFSRLRDPTTIGNGPVLAVMDSPLPDVTDHNAPAKPPTYSLAPSSLLPIIDGHSVPPSPANSNPTLSPLNSAPSSPGSAHQRIRDTASSFILARPSPRRMLRFPRTGHQVTITNGTDEMIIFCRCWRRCEGISGGTFWV
ncbi:hypothetical protein BJV78DRAFT_946019 [Lactifluus subvellereus]|nr:hypothetical protein BJV78DRAFT_946019 [Lactifluus subvellereus]